MEHSAFPSDETLAAFIDGQLDEETRKRVVAHVADCEDCYGTVMASRSFQSAEEKPVTLSHPRSWKALWISSGSVAAAAVIGLVIFAAPLRNWYDQYSYEQRTGMSSLRMTVNALPYRTIEGRVAERFAYKPIRPALRGKADDDRWRLEGASADIKEHALAVPSDQSLRALGTAYLLLGDYDTAIDRLEEALFKETGTREWSVSIGTATNSRLLNDIAVAYYERSRATQRPADLARAYEAANRAWVISKSSDIAWNRALILQALGMVDEANAAWRTYLQIDSDPAWKREATERMQPISGSGRSSGAVDNSNVPPGQIHVEQNAAAEAELWKAVAIDDEHFREAERLGSGVCASHVDCVVSDTISSLRSAARRRDDSVLSAFLRGCSLVRESRTRGADWPSRYRAAAAALVAFRRSGVPIADRLQVLIAASEYEHNDPGQALRSVRSVGRRRLEETTLFGAQARWGEGNALQSLGYSSEALAAYTSSANTFYQMGAAASAAGVELLIGETLRFMGEPEDALQHDLRAVAQLQSSHDKARYVLALISAGRTTWRLGCARAARLFDDEAVRVARGVDVTYYCFALVSRSTLEIDSGDVASARPDFSEAENVYRSVPDADVRDRIDRDLLLLRGRLASDPSAMEKALNGAILHLTRLEDHYRLARAHLLLGKVEDDAGAARSAEEQFEAGLDELKSERTRLSAASARVTFLDTAQELRDSLAILLVREGRITEALSAVEAVRARGLIERIGGPNDAPFDATALMAAVPVGASLVEYVVTSKVTLALIAQRSGVKAVTLNVGKSWIDSLTRRFADDVEMGRDVTSLATTGFDAIIRPLKLPDGGALIIVPDGALNRMPFSALLDSPHPQYLVERYETDILPSADVFVRLTSAGRRHDLQSALVIRDPTPTESLHLPVLPTAAKRDALIGNAAIRYLTGANATPDTCLALADEYDVLQFDVHGIEERGRYALALSPSAAAPDGLLDAAWLESRRLTRPWLVVLAACSTARGKQTASEGELSVARAFLASNIPVVVATRWPVDDAASAELMRVFYAQLSRGSTVSASLRLAQLALMRRAPYRHPKYWAGYVALGGA